MTESHDRCSEAERLRNIYTAALEKFHRQWPPFNIGSTSADPRSRELKETARKGIFDAGKAYWDHLLQHGCKRPESWDW
jgi:hypothetical protein